MSGEEERPVSSRLVHDQSPCPESTGCPGIGSTTAGDGVQIGPHDSSAMLCWSHALQSGMSPCRAALDAPSAAAIAFGAGIPCTAATAKTASHSALRNRRNESRFIARRICDGTAEVHDPAFTSARPNAALVHTV